MAILTLIILNWFSLRHAAIVSLINTGTEQIILGEIKCLIHFSHPFAPALKLLPF